MRPLDPRLGKVADVSAASILPDGTPLLILDVEDLVRSIVQPAPRRRSSAARSRRRAAARRRTKRVLVVDDSITVREVERQLLTNRGYEVDVAVDGMDGWNALRNGDFDLVITDVDMPRMNGIELVRSIKQDPRLRAMPVMIVSYKDREEDRLRGLEAGADYYLTKSNFHDEQLVRAVRDLIGEAGAMRIAIVNDSPLAVEALRRVDLARARLPGRLGGRRRRRGGGPLPRGPARPRADGPLMPVMDGVEARGGSWPSRRARSWS